MDLKNYEKYPVFYNGEFAILYDCSSEIPHLAIGVWRGFFQLTNKKFIDEMWLSLDFIKQKNIVAIISDHSDLLVVKQDVLAWLKENWYPNAAKYGLRIEASLNAENPIARLSLRQMLDKARTGTISSPVFPHFQAAYNFCGAFLREYIVNKR